MQMCSFRGHESLTSRGAIRILMINLMPNNHRFVFKTSPPGTVKILFRQICKNSFNVVKGLKSTRCRADFWKSIVLRLRPELMPDRILAGAVTASAIRLPANAECNHHLYYLLLQGRMLTRINILKCRKSSIAICDRRLTF
jgi:hypothetical protein